jgi:hypothetical protein
VGDHGLNTHRAPMGQLGQLARRCPRHIERGLVFIAGPERRNDRGVHPVAGADLGST